MSKAIILVILLIGVVSCTSNAYKQGLAVGERLCSIGNKDSINELPTIIEEYNTIEDSISAISATEVADFNNGVFYAVKNGNDTLKYAARVIVDSPTVNGWRFAKEGIKALLSKEITSHALKDKIELIHYLYNKTGEDNSNVEFDKALQSHIDSLSVDKQMLIYTSVATPASIANELANDIANGVDCKRQIEELKKIYKDGSIEQTQFLEALNNRMPTLINDKKSE